MKITYQGMKATKKHLNIYARMDVGTAVRFVTIPIPITEIDIEIATEAIDRKVRVDLISIWAAERGEDLELW